MAKFEVIPGSFETNATHITLGLCEAGYKNIRYISFDLNKLIDDEAEGTIAETASKMLENYDDDKPVSESFVIHKI